MTQNHTLTPIYIEETNPDDNGKRFWAVRFDDGELSEECFDAETVYRACNAHDDLVTALEKSHQDVIELARERDPDQLGMWDAIFTPAKAALAKAKAVQ